MRTVDALTIKQETYKNILNSQHIGQDSVCFQNHDQRNKRTIQE